VGSVRCFAYSAVFINVIIGLDCVCIGGACVHARARVCLGVLRCIMLGLFRVLTLNDRIQVLATLPVRRQ
jgi:hypothetical protein